MNSRIVWIVVAVVAALVFVRFGLPLLNPPNDQKMIQEALRDSIEASREGRPGGVMDKLSDHFKINDMDPGSRSQIANFIKNSRPDVEVENQKAVVTGDTATIVSPIRLKIDFLGQRLDKEIRDVTIVFAKEDATQYLVIPTRKWRLVEVRAPDTAVQEFLQ